MPSHYLLLDRLERSKYPVHTVGDREVTESIVDGPFGSQLKVDEYQTTGVPLIRVKNCSQGVIVPGPGLVYISSEKHQQLIRSEVLPGDVLLTKAGSLGYSAVFPPELGKGNITSHLARLRPTPKILSEFLSYYLSSQFGIDQVYRWGNKTTRPELNTDEVRRIRIPLPPIKIQKSLTNSLNYARQARKEKLAEAVALLAGMDEYVMEKLGLEGFEEARRSTFAVRLRDIRGKRIDALAYQPVYQLKKHPRTTLKALNDLARINPHRTPPHPPDDSVVPYVGLPECNERDIREVAIRPYSEVRGRKIFKQGDILFARIEPSIFNKKYVYVDDTFGHEHIYTSTEFQVVRAREGVEPLFLYAMLFSRLVFSQVSGKTTGSSGRRRIGEDIFKRILVPSPPKKIQEVIAREFSVRKSESVRLRQEAENDWEAAKAQFESQLVGMES